MKKIGLALAVAMFGGAMWCLAADVFQVKTFRGVITTTNGTIKVKSTADLSTNNWIVIIDQVRTNNTCEIDEVSGTTTNQVKTADYGAFINKGRFNFDLEGATFTPANTNLPKLHGSLQVTGKITPAPESGKAAKTVTMQIVGAWNVPSWSTTNSDLPASFKGTLTATK